MNRKLLSIIVTVLALLALAWLLMGRTTWAATDPPPAIASPGGDPAASGSVVRPPNAPSALLSTCWVTNTNDSGAGSLRQAIIDANNNAGPDTIGFNISAATDPGCNAGSGVCAVAPTTTLPSLTGGGTTIDGYTQSGASPATDTVSATLKIEVDGTNAGSSNGLFVTSASNVIRGLAINRFSLSGIYINGATSNTVSGNYVGTDVGGTADLGNTQYGVRIAGGAKNNTVGGDTAGERNIISGNNQDGVCIAGSDTTGNTVSGNYIGTDANGTANRGNTVHGVRIAGGAQNNTVGGDAPGERNIISANNSDGVHIEGSGATGNTVSGNYIGTDAAGTTALGNYVGVYIGGGAQSNTVGGDASGERNVISGNSFWGVFISDNGTMSNTVSGNYIGTDVNGTADRGNSSGVIIVTGAQNNTVGGDTPGKRNVIAGNEGDGVRIAGSGTTSNTVSGNYIGTDVNGTADLGNNEYGVDISFGAISNTVGPGNLIAHNDWHGVEVNGSSATGNIITQNSIYSNTMGIDLVDGANGDIAAPVIVTTTAGSVNVVGTACASCTVDVFSNGDTDGEGETYVGSTTATAGGVFTVTLSTLYKPYLTATATDAISGTSEFSAVFTSTVRGGKIYLPVVIKMQ